MIDFGVAYDKLAQFETADEIAEYFRGEGIKGSCGLYSSCAIAVWMTKTTGRMAHVSTSDIWVIGEQSPIGDRVTLNHTDAMMDFVYHFDHGHYPDLIDKKEPGYQS